MKTFDSVIIYYKEKMETICEILYMINIMININSFIIFSNNRGTLYEFLHILSHLIFAQLFLLQILKR